MRIDSSQFPIVYVSFSSGAGSNVASSFADFEKLLERRTAFVMIAKDTIQEDTHEHSHEEKKSGSLWMKRNKDALREYVKGMIMVEPNAAKRLAGKAFALGFGKFWGYPLYITASSDDALEMASNLLGAEKA